MRGRAASVVLTLAALASACIGIAEVPARAAPAASASLEQCRERFAIVPGVDAAVAPRVPAGYELSRDPEGHPLLYITAIRCERYRVGRSARPTTAAAFAAMIKSPDGVGCASAWPVVGEHKGDALSCNMYVLFAAYDNPAVVSWLRAGNTDLPVHFVPDLHYDESGFDVATVGQRRNRWAQGSLTKIVLEGERGGR